VPVNHSAAQVEAALASAPAARVDTASALSGAACFGHMYCIRVHCMWHAAETPHYTMQDKTMKAPFCKDGSVCFYNAQQLSMNLDKELYTANTGGCAGGGRPGGGGGAPPTGGMRCSKEEGGRAYTMI
jgi:hypothetical protein